MIKKFILLTLLIFVSACASTTDYGSSPKSKEEIKDNLNNNSEINYKIISKNPNKIKRGLFGKSYIKKGYNKKSLKHIYNIIEDPTGSAPTNLVERFELRPEDCSKQRHGNKSNENDCITGRTRIEIYQTDKKHIRKSQLKKKDLEYWYQWYIYFSDEFHLSENANQGSYLGQFLTGDWGESGQGPSFFCSESNGKFNCLGAEIGDKKNLKNKWHKITYNIRWSTKNTGFVKLFHNDKLIRELTDITTLNRDRVMLKYGIYRSPVFSSGPVEGNLPDKTVVYYSGFKVAKDKKDLD